MEFNVFNKQIFIRKEAAIGIVAALVIIFGVIGYFISNNSQKVTIDTVENKNIQGSIIDSSADIGKADESLKNEENIQVYVSGCVKNPGIVNLKKGQIINDAINAAGGATEEADLSNINLVYKLNDNVTINIKSKKDTQITNNTAALPLNSKVVETKHIMKAQDSGKGVEIIKDSQKSTVAQGTNANGIININTASSEELNTLPGVGDETAKDIISYREKNGGFKTIEDIMKVPGIKEGKFKKIKDRITVD